MENYQVVVAIIVTIIMLGIAVGFIAILVAYSNRRALLFTKEKENLELQFNEQLLRSQIEIQEQTLQQISRELHDNIGQVASLIKINLSTLTFADPAAASIKIEDSVTLTRQLIADLRSLSASLNSDLIARSGFATALEQLVQQLQKTGLFTATFSQHGDVPQFSNDKLIVLYRMCQEIINNMIKHSQASQVAIHLKTTDSVCSIVLEDNGHGFDLDHALQNGGAGLINLKKRAGMIDAQFSINTSPGNGTCTTITLPVG